MYRQTKKNTEGGGGQISVVDQFSKYQFTKLYGVTPSAFSRLINSMNRRNLGYKLAVNHMADYSPEEMKMMRGYRTDKTSPQGDMYVPTMKLKDVPVSMNWWLRGEGEVRGR